LALCTRELGGQGQIEKVGLNAIRNGVRDGMWGRGGRT
jgi:hypothetical protein